MYIKIALAICLLGFSISGMAECEKVNGQCYSTSSSLEIECLTGTELTISKNYCRLEFPYDSDYYMMTFGDGRQYSCSKNSTLPDQPRPTVIKGTWKRQPISPSSTPENPTTLWKCM